MPFAGNIWFPHQEINEKLAHVNGAPIAIVSITFSSKQEYDMIKDRIMRGDYNYGDDIVIETPACVNVKVCQSLDGKHQETKRRQSQLEVLQNSPVTGTESSFLWCNPRETKNQRNTISSMDPPSNPTQKYRFMTHLNSNKDSLWQCTRLKGESFYKAHTHSSFEEANGYISRLKPVPDVMAIYRGFTGNPQEGQVWDNQLALGWTN